MIKITIGNIAQASKLVKLASNKKYADYDIDCSHGRYIIDMKSIMGMMSLAWPKEVEVEIHADEDVQDEFYEEVREIVE